MILHQRLFSSYLQFIYEFDHIYIQTFSLTRRPSSFSLGVLQDNKNIMNSTSLHNLIFNCWCYLQTTSSVIALNTRYTLQHFTSSFNFHVCRYYIRPAWEGCCGSAAALTWGLPRLPSPPRPRAAWPHPRRTPASGWVPETWRARWGTACWRSGSPSGNWGRTKKS